MTTVVGVLCRDGAVVGTDSAVTFSHPSQLSTVEQETNKLYVAGNVIIAGTGQMGLGQRFRSIVQHAWDTKVFERDPIAVIKELSRSGIEDFHFTYFKPGQYGAIVAFPSGDRAHLCEFQVDDFQPELKDERIWYASLGSAQFITDPFLALMRKVFWQDGAPKVADAIFAVTWTLQHAIDVNPGGVRSPINLAVLERTEHGQLKARQLDPSELEQHLQNVEAAIEHLREYPKRLHSASATELPRPPG